LKKYEVKLITETFHNPADEFDVKIKIIAEFDAPFTHEMCLGETVNFKNLLEND